MPVTTLPPRPLNLSKSPVPRSIILTDIFSVVFTYRLFQAKLVTATAQAMPDDARVDSDNESDGEHAGPPSAPTVRAASPMSEDDLPPLALPHPVRLALYFVALGGLIDRINALQVLDPGAPAHVLTGPQVPSKTAGPYCTSMFSMVFLTLLIFLIFLAVSPFEAPALRVLTALMADLSLQSRPLVQ